MMRRVATAFIAMMILGSVLTITKSTAATGRRTSTMNLTDTNAVLLPNRSPLVSFRILFMTGSAVDPKGKEGLASLTAAMLAEGSAAPDFTLPDQDGDPVSLSDFRGRWLVLWWFPKAFTSG